MEIANCTVALAGDQGNSVPKFGVTAAEIAVLRVLHGEDAVTNIEPAGNIERADRAEVARLTRIYGVNHEGRIRAKAVDMLFPGAAARVFHKLSELDMPEEMFAATGRKGGRAIAEREFDSIEAERAAEGPKLMKTVPVQAENAEPKKAKKPKKEKKPTKKQLAQQAAEAKAKAEAEAAAALADDTGIGDDMDDNVLG